MSFDAAVIFIFMAIVDNSNEHLQRQISLKDRTSRFSSARSPRNGRQPIFKIEFVMALIKGLFFRVRHGKAALPARISVRDHLVSRAISNSPVAIYQH